MSEIANQFFFEAPPTSSATPGVGITNIAVTNTAASIDLDAFPGLFGRRLLIIADADTHFSFSASPVTIDETVSGASASAGTTPVVSFLLPSKVVFATRLTKTDHRYLNVKTATTAHLRFFARSQKRMSDMP